jgi:hypothetical protein
MQQAAQRFGGSQQAGLSDALPRASLYREIIDFAAESGLPAIYQWREHSNGRGSRIMRAQRRGDVAADGDH